MEYIAKITIKTTNPANPRECFADLIFKGMYVSKKNKDRHADIQKAISDKLIPAMQSKHPDKTFTVKKALISAHKMDFVFSENHTSKNE